MSERHVEKSSSANKKRVEINSKWGTSDHKIQRTIQRTLLSFKRISNCGAELEKDLMIT